jgi:long-chain acyl-CoA synthetase
MKMHTPIKTLRQLADTRPNDIAIIYGEQSWTYEKLATGCERLARGMINHGIRNGDRVVLHMMNRPEMIMAYYACFRIGAIAAPLRTAYKAAELKPLLERLKPSFYIGDADLYAKIADVKLPSLKRDARFTFDQLGDHAELQSCTSLLCDDIDGLMPEPPSEQSPALLITTSGTSGVAKFVTHTAATLAATAEGIRHLDFLDNETALIPNALAHASGLDTFLGCMRFAGKCVLLAGFQPDIALDAIERHGCTWFNTMPAMAAMLLERQKARPRNVSSFRICTVGGDAAPEKLLKEFPLYFGIPLRPYWVSTEAAFSFTFVSQSQGATRPIRSGETRLVDESDKSVPQGSVGELLVRGPNVSPGYWDDGNIVDPFQDGWFRTGDMMRQDEHGDYWFVSRKKDLIIRGGTNISPVEIENVLAACDSAIKTAAVVGAPDEIQGQRIIGFVQLEEGTRTIDLVSLLAKLKERIADYKVPERVEIVKAIPRNSLGKVDRAALLAMV